MSATTYIVTPYREQSTENREPGVGKAERTAAGQVVTALKVKDFQFTSLSGEVSRGEKVSAMKNVVCHG